MAEVSFIQRQTSSILWSPQESKRFDEFEKCKPDVPTPRYTIGPKDLGTWIKAALKKEINIKDLSWDDLAQARYGDKVYGKYLKKMNENVYGRSLDKPADIVEWNSLNGLLGIFSDDFGNPLVYQRYPLGSECKEAGKAEATPAEPPRVDVKHPDGKTKPAGKKGLPVRPAGGKQGVKFQPLTDEDIRKMEDMKEDLKKEENGAEGGEDDGEKIE